MAYLDLEHKIRTDGEFRALVLRYSKELQVLHEKQQTNDAVKPQYKEKLRDFLKLCNNNLVLLMSFYFPKYPKNKALTFVDYPFSYQLLDVHFGNSTTIRGSRQISKSTTFCARQLMLTRLFSKFSSMYLCPRSDQLDTYATRLRDMERSLYDYKPDYKLRSNLHLKEFANGSKIELAYVHTSATNIRGKSCDSMLVDESQDFDPELEIETRMIQSASETPITTFAGTSLTTDTFLEKKYVESSQAVWVMTCRACGHFNVPMPETGVFEMIQPIGPCCSKCLKPIDVRDGEFAHTNDEAFRAERYGYHIPQLIVPAVVKNVKRWAQIYELKCKGDKRKFLQEVLGIPTEEGEREITRQHLMDLCTLGRDLGALKWKAANGKYQFVVSGCDWGGSDYQPMSKTKVSTTVHVIMGVTPLGECHILHISRHTGMNYDDIANTIIREHTQHAAKAIASDYGVGAVYNSRLREKLPPDRHLIFGYVGPTTDLLSAPKGPHIFNQWSLNKTESLSMTFDAIRNRRIRCFDWEYAAEYLMDCLNMYRAPGEKAGAAGTNTFIYRTSASKPNDTLQALNYAFMLAKILMGDPMFADMSSKLQLDANLKGHAGFMGGGAYSG
jgi:hypothetical protein